MTEPILELVGLSKSFPIPGRLFGRSRGEVKAVRGVSLAIRAGEFFGLAGESGSGKSTLARMILGLAAPSAGSLLFEGREIDAAAAGGRAYRRAVQMVFQNPGSSLNPRRSVGQSIAVPIKAHGLARGRDIRRRIDTLLDQVQLPAAMAERYPHELSGGQKQRVAIARALAVEPRLLVLDEPTSALDVSVQARIIDLLTVLGRDLGLTYVFISHDLGLMRNFVDRVGILYLGQLVETGDVRAVFETPAHPYTRSLLAAVPVISAAEEALKPKVPMIEGEIPNPADLPSGCAFHPRCPTSIPGRCAGVDPGATKLAAGHQARCHLLSLPREGEHA